LITLSTYVYIRAKDNDECIRKEMMLDSFVKIHEFEVSEKFIDIGFSGIDPNRPEWNRLQSTLKENDDLICTAPENLSRKTFDLFDLENRNISIYSATLGGKINKSMINLLEAINIEIDKRIEEERELH
jgi:hypothetical protein